MGQQLPSRATDLREGERGVLAVPALQLVLQPVEHLDDLGAGSRDIVLLTHEEVGDLGQALVVELPGIGDRDVGDQPLDPTARESISSSGRPT